MNRAAVNKWETLHKLKFVLSMASVFQATLLLGIKAKRLCDLSGDLTEEAFLRRRVAVKGVGKLRKN